MLKFCSQCNKIIFLWFTLKEVVIIYKQNRFWYHFATCLSVKSIYLWDLCPLFANWIDWRTKKKVLWAYTFSIQPLNIIRCSFVNNWPRLKIDKLVINETENLCSFCKVCQLDKWAFRIIILSSYLCLPWLNG